MDRDNSGWTCNTELRQHLGTCYFNTPLNAIFLSNRLLNIALQRLTEYKYMLINKPKNIIKIEHLEANVLHIQLPKHLVKVNLSAISGESEQRIVKIDITDPIPEVQQQKRDELAHFLIMKLMYMYLCEKLTAYNDKKIFVYAFPTDFVSSMNEGKTCPEGISEIIALIASIVQGVHSKINIKYDSETELHDSIGGPPFYAFKTILKYVYGYETYKKKVKIINAYDLTYTKTNLIETNEEPEILIFMTGNTDVSNGMKQSESVDFPLNSMNINRKKGYQQTLNSDILKLIFNKNILRTYDSIKDELRINNTKYKLDNISYSYLSSQKLKNPKNFTSHPSHTVLGIECNNKPYIVDLNGYFIPTNWKKLDDFKIRDYEDYDEDDEDEDEDDDEEEEDLNRVLRKPFDINKKDYKEFIKFKNLTKLSELKNFFGYDYICYVKEDIVPIDLNKTDIQQKISDVCKRHVSTLPTPIPLLSPVLSGGSKITIKGDYYITYFKRDYILLFPINITNTNPILFGDLNNEKNKQLKKIPLLTKLTITESNIAKKKKLLSIIDNHPIYSYEWYVKINKFEHILYTLPLNEK
jgi:hypothetical protein